MEIGVKLRDVVKSDEACKALGINPYCVAEGADGEELISMSFDLAVSWGLLKSKEEVVKQNTVLRKRIFGRVSDLVSDLLYYGRHEDEDLGVGAIEQAVKDQIISVDEMIQIFGDELRNKC